MAGPQPWARVPRASATRSPPRPSFTVTTRDSGEEVARGAHNRFIVDVAKTKQRLAAKAAKAKEA